MAIIHQVFVFALYVARYLGCGGVAVFLGGFLHRQWYDLETPRWSTLIGIFLFGFAIWHLHDLVTAIASQSEASGS